MERRERGKEVVMEGGREEGSYRRKEGGKEGGRG